MGMKDSQRLEAGSPDSRAHTMTGKEWENVGRTAEMGVPRISRDNFPQSWDPNRADPDVFFTS